MRKRNIHIQFWLNQSEANQLDKRVQQSGLSREVYLRHLINGLQPTNAPPPDYYTMMRQLHSIGNNLNQIARKAHVMNILDTERYDKNITALNASIITITNAVMLPRKMAQPQQTHLPNKAE